ncbi:uncharacterized protein LOC130703746 [Daphnia carinata]|uniref:uncharacterized protein LOC130703746 n=1 Tax=Daphnia carinata TaxID=120202 RepID=UPI00257CE8A1|nr:uncharacterized protein LOC130703746 [Daphnia carinata]
MNREPPKNVYCNNRLKKIEPVVRPISNKRQASQYTSAATSSGMTETVIAVNTKNRSLHFNKSQSKYEKHFEPSSSKVLASKKLKESPHGNTVLPLNFKNPSTLGDLGIPLKHCYVQRKTTSSINHCSLQPVSKKYRKNLDSSKLQSNLLCVHRTESSDNPLWQSPQESPNQLIEKSNSNDQHDASEFFQMVKATLQDTFKEIVKDCPEFLTTSLNAKEKLLKKLRSYTQRQQTTLADHANTEDMSSSESDSLLDFTRPIRFNRFPGESSTESQATKPKLRLNNATPTCVGTTDAWAPVAYGFKSYTTPRGFLPRSRRCTGSTTYVTERTLSDAIQISSKGSSVQVNGSLSFNRSCSKNNLEETDESTHACLPVFNPCKVPSFSRYPTAFGN